MLKDRRNETDMETRNEMREGGREEEPPSQLR